MQRILTKTTIFYDRPIIHVKSWEVLSAVVYVFNESPTEVSQAVSTKLFFILCSWVRPIMFDRVKMKIYLIKPGSSTSEDKLIRLAYFTTGYDILHQKSFSIIFTILSEPVNDNCCRLLKDFVNIRCNRMYQTPRALQVHYE